MKDFVGWAVRAGVAAVPPPDTRPSAGEVVVLAAAGRYNDVFAAKTWGGAGR